LLHLLELHHYYTTSETRAIMDRLHFNQRVFPSAGLDDDSPHEVNSDEDVTPHASEVGKGIDTVGESVDTSRLEEGGDESRFLF
jgi:hypothetical protein